MFRASAPPSAEAGGGRRSRGRRRRLILILVNFRNVLPTAVGSTFVPCNFSFYYRTAARIELLRFDVAVAARAIFSFSTKLPSFCLTEVG